MPSLRPIPAVPCATSVGRLSAQSGRPSPRSAMSASRRLRPSAARDRKIRSHPKGGNSLKSLQEIRTRSHAHRSISIQEGQPIISTSVIRDSRKASARPRCGPTDVRKAETDHAPDRFLRRESEVQVRSGTRNRFADSGRPNCAQMAAAPRRDTNLDHYRPRVKLHSG